MNIDKAIKHLKKVDPKMKLLVKKYGLFKEEDCPNANCIMENGFYLPSGNNIKNEEIDFICNSIIKHSKSI